MTRGAKPTSVLLSSADQAIPWYNTNWLYRVKITQDHTKLSASLTNFTVEVPLANSAILKGCQQDGKDILFTASDGLTRLNHKLITVPQNGGSGCWSWFSDPRAIYVPTMGGTVFGYVSAGGNVVAGFRSDKTAAITTFTLSSALETDDHDNPVFVRRTDTAGAGKLVAFYCKHSTDTTMRYRVSTNVDDISAWAAESTLARASNVTYMNPFIMSDNKCVVFSRVFRGDTVHYDPAYVYTTDYSSWSSDVNVFDVPGHRPYLKYAQHPTNPNRIDVLATDGQPDEKNTSVYHWYMIWGGTSFTYFTSYGTQITTALPFGVNDVTRLYDGSQDSTDKPKAWIWQIAYNALGNPVVLWSKNKSSVLGSYWYQCWNGAGWTTPVQVGANQTTLSLTQGDQPSYSPGICFDGVTTNTVYMAATSNGATAEIVKMVTTDNGATWLGTTAITSNSGSGLTNARPFSPKAHSGHTDVLWWAGQYGTGSPSYSNYITYVSFYPTMPTAAAVSIPSLSSSVDATWYMYFGNSSTSLTTQESTSSVFDSSYLAVWHFAPTPASLLLTDEQGRANAFRAAINLPGQIATSQGPALCGLNNTTNAWAQHQPAGNTGQGVNMAGLAAITVSALFQSTLGGGSPHTIYSNWDYVGGGHTTAGVIFRVTNSTGALNCFATMQTDTQVGGNTTATVTANTIQHVAMTVDATAITGYVDGVAGGTTFATSSAAMDADATKLGEIGRANATNYLLGEIYELRISNVARAIDWTLAEANNLKAPTTFTTYGTVQYLYESV